MSKFEIGDKVRVVHTSDFGVIVEDYSGAPGYDYGIEFLPDGVVVYGFYESELEAV